MALPQLRKRATALAGKAFRPGTASNHRMQARTYKAFCATYDFRWEAPSVNQLVLYVTHLVAKFTTASAVRNYFSGVRQLFKQMDLQPAALDSHLVTWQLRAAELTMRTEPSPKLPITPPLLASLCRLCQALGPLGPAMRTALMFGLFGMLRQSNLAPPTAADFDSSRHTCRGDVMRAAPGLIIWVKWSKTQQAAGTSSVLPLLSGHPADPVAAHEALLQASPTTGDDQPLLTYNTTKGSTAIVTIPKLAQALADMLEVLGLPATRYSLHSLRRGGATAAYKEGVTPEAVKRHGHWSSSAFWGYISAPAAANSTVAAALGAAVAATTPQA